MKNYFDYEIELLYFSSDKNIIIYNDQNLGKLVVFDVLKKTVTNKLDAFNNYLNSSNKLTSYYRSRYNTFISAEHNYLMVQGAYYSDSKLFEIPIVNLNTYELQSCLVDLSIYEDDEDIDENFEFNIFFTAEDNIVAIETPDDTLLYDIEDQIIIQTIDKKFGKVLTFYPDNKFAITYKFIIGEEKNRIKILDLEKDEIVGNLNYPFDSLIRAKFSPEQKYLSFIIPEESDFIISSTDNSSLLQVSDFKNRKTLYCLGSKFPKDKYWSCFIEEIFYSSDNKYGIISFFNTYSFVIFELQTGRKVKEIVASNISYDTKTDKLAYLVKELDGKFVIKIQHINKVIF